MVFFFLIISHRQHNRSMIHRAQCAHLLCVHFSMNNDLLCVCVWVWVCVCVCVVHVETNATKRAGDSESVEASSKPQAVWSNDLTRNSVSVTYLLNTCNTRRTERHRANSLGSPSNLNLQCVFSLTLLCVVGFIPV